MKVKFEKNKGFTIVELLMAIILSAILLITAGAMLYYGWLNWHKNSVKMMLQQDALYAMDILDRTIRPVNKSDLSISGSRLLESGNDFLRFNGSNLEIFSGAAYQVILNNIASPSFVSVNPVTIQMTLQRQINQSETESVALDFVVNGRN